MQAVTVVTPREACDKKKKLVAALRAGVSPEGQRLFVAINKTLDEVSWDNEDIVVMRNVRISPPYTVECVRGDTAAVNHVRKIVLKHQLDSASTSASPPPVPQV